MNGSDLLKRLLEGGAPGSSTSVKGGELLDKLLNSGLAGGLLGGAISGGLSGMLFGGKGGKKIAKTALQVGSLAAIGGLAYAAYNRYRQSTAQAPQSAPGPHGELGEPPPPESGFLPPAADTATQSTLALAVLRAMIGAAKADGHIDAKEQERIFDHLKQVDLSAEEKAFVLEELSRPLDIDAIVRLGATPELATEIYTASVLAVDVDSPAERAYLEMLAARLGLAPGLVSEIHATVERATSGGG